MGFVGWTIHNKHHNWKITMFHGRTPISACSSTMFDGYINVVKYLNYLPPKKNLFFIIIFPIYDTSMFPVFSLWILHFPLLRDPIFFIPLRWQALKVSMAWSWQPVSSCPLWPWSQEVTWVESLRIPRTLCWWSSGIAPWIWFSSSTFLGFGGWTPWAWWWWSIWDPFSGQSPEICRHCLFGSLTRRCSTAWANVVLDMARWESLGKGRHLGSRS